MNIFGLGPTELLILLVIGGVPLFYLVKSVKRTSVTPLVHPPAQPLRGVAGLDTRAAGERLAELQNLRAEGLITQADFEAHQMEIVATL